MGRNKGYFTGSSMSSGEMFTFSHAVSAKRTEDPRHGAERISYGSGTEIIPSNMAG